jgi:hypothetical protein
MLRLRSTWLAMLCLFCLLAGLTRCAFSPPQYVRTEPRDAVIYVIAGGWHTELALPVSTISAPLATLEPGFGNARYLVFGWGARDYYMARDPGFEDLLRALVPGPAVLLVIPLQVSPEAFVGAANVFAVPVSRGGAERLSQFLWEYPCEGRGRGITARRHRALPRKRLLCLDRNFRSRAYLQHLDGRGSTGCRLACQFGGHRLRGSASRSAPAVRGGKSTVAAGSPSRSSRRL